MRGGARNGIARFRKQTFQQGETNVDWKEKIQYGPEERFVELFIIKNIHLGAGRFVDCVTRYDIKKLRRK
jgi:hypothetical protein